MKLKRIAGFVSCFIMVSVFAKAQTDPPMLTLKDAVEIALKNNYNIVLAKNNQAIAQNNFTLGNAGFLPSVSGTLTQSNSQQHIDLMVV